MSLDPAIAWTLRLGFALLFLSAAAHKLRDRRGFRETLAAYAILPGRWVGPASVVFPGAEAGIGAALLLAAAPAAGALAGVALLGIYATAIGINLHRGREALSCGCGGLAGDRPIGLGLVVRNAVLMGLLALLLLPTAGRAIGALDVATAGFAAAVSGLLYAGVDVALSNAVRLGAPRASLGGAR